MGPRIPRVGLELGNARADGFEHDASFGGIVEFRAEI
jgi:hypothetical protein